MFPGSPDPKVIELISPYEAELTMLFESMSKLDGERVTSVQVDVAVDGLEVHPLGSGLE